MGLIHPTAIVAEGAHLDPSVSVGPYAVIGPHVTMGARTTVGAHCVIEGHTTIGADNRIFQFSSLGAVPQDKKYAGEPTQLVIGDRNTIREFCTFNLGTAQDAGVTRMGDDTLAGHVEVGDWATVGGLTGVLQRMRIGAHTMVGFASHVGKDVPPFMVVDGNPLAVRAVNLVGLRRRDFSAERLAAIRDMHKIIYRQGKTLDEARTAIQALAIDMPEAAADIALMDNFLGSSVSGIAR